VSAADILPTILGIGLVAGAAVFALLPFVHPAAETAAADAGAPAESGPTDRALLYRQVLELEFDVQLGKLAADDYERLSHELLAEAGLALQQERSSLNELDEEIEREIAAARAALAAARQISRARNPAGTPS
jgi:hypothetical protein